MHVNTYNQDMTMPKLEEKIDQESEKLVIKIDQKGEEVKNSLIKWLIGFFVAQMAVFFSMIQIIK